MPSPRDHRPRRGRKLIGAVALMATLLALAALPAAGHPSFGAAAGFDFKPNQRGGTGLAGSTPPYDASSTPALWLRLPYEQTEPHNSNPDTTVDVNIVVPAGWTNPVCGEPYTTINDASTNNTNQPGTLVPGWTCEIVTANSRKVLHYSGPQIQAPGTPADSAQWFRFSVTTPSPSVQTTYNGTAGTEGFIADQRYASGETEHWIPNAEFTGNPPVGSNTAVAGGLARTVAPPTLGSYTGLDPARLLDTRKDIGLTDAFGPAQTRDLKVTEVGGVPADATAVVLNVTATQGTGASDLRLWPAGQTQPTASNLNWIAGETVPNLVKVKVGTDGKVSIRNAAGGVDVVADVVGYYAATGDDFTGIQPDRILDTRKDIGLTDAFGPAQARDLEVTDVAGVPVDATAVVLNVTATGGTAASHLTVYPHGHVGDPPRTSNLNWPAGATRPNLVIAKVGEHGEITLRNEAGTVDVIADVVGYYTSTGDRFAGVQPTRILDTRNDTGLIDEFTEDDTRDLTIAGAEGIPAGATAVVLNVTATGGTTGSHLTVWPAGADRPTTSNLNWVANQTVPNLVVVDLGAGGAISLRNHAGDVHVVADVVGYFIPEATPA